MQLGDTDPVLGVLEACNDLYLWGLLQPSEVKTLDHDRFNEAIPEGLRRFVDDRRDHILEICLHLRFTGQREVREVDFLCELTDVISQLHHGEPTLIASQEMALAVQALQGQVCVFVALAIYAKQSAVETARLRQQGQILTWQLP